MQNYCKNCGARITETDQICPDCKKPIQKNQMNFCPGCGQKLYPNQKFCSVCGYKIEQKEEESLLKKHKIPIIIACLVFLAVIAVAAISTVSIYSTQEVTVDTLNFEIPDSFQENALYSTSEAKDGIVTKSKYWESSDDFIEIEVMYSTSPGVNASQVNDYMGGERQSMCGYDGYFNDLADAYSFSFVKDNKICTVYTSDYNLLSQVEAI